MNRIEISESAFQPHEIPEFLLNLAFCIVAAFLLRHLYVRKSISLSGKFHIGTVIPILATVTFLVIMVVKSSLALSLGLVGALSVIRFRTPIKEPEELVYLFLAIALGLGYGAGQTIVTSLVFVIISGMILLVSMIGAIVLTYQKREGLKRQSYFKQISRERDTSIEIVDVKKNKGVKIDA